MEKFVYDIFDTIETPTFVLSNIYHHHIGVINNIDVDSINTNFNMASAQEMSFDVYKEVDGEVCDVWDSIVGLKYVFVPEFNEYYKADVTLNEDNRTVKSVTLTSAGEYELSNKKIVNLEINTESDILQEDYVTTVFYDENNPRGSLLDRVLNDKAPDWSIGHVDDTLKNIQRTFSINGQTIYDTLVNTIAKEINCLFTFDSVNRVINAYDLLNKCSSCGYRGEFLTTCPKCGGKEFIRGYGENSNILINYNNYSEKMTVDGGEDKVKNCFKVTGGDDNMNAAIRNCNPNGSHYIYSFSDADYEDMPPELVQKLIEYGEMYEEILPEYEEVVAQYYNNLNCYHYYKTTMMPRLSGEHWEANKGYNVGDRAYVMTLPTWCYLECVQAGVSGNTEFDATRVTVDEEFIDGTVIWQAKKNIIDVPSAQQSLDAIIEYFETNEIYFLNNIPSAITEVNNEVKNIAALQINNIFRIEIILDDDNKVEGNIWTGRIKVYNTGNEDDKATSENPVTVYLKISSEPMDYINYMSNKVEKRLNKKDVEFTSIFDIEIPRDETTYEYLPDEDNQFKEALTGYGLDWLSNFSKSYQGCIETLISNGVTDKDSNIVGYELYDPMYVPYYARMGYINDELAIRQATVDEYEALYKANKNTMSDYHKQMDMRTFLGDDLYKTLYNYIREDDYNNTNYISDGLSDGEILQDARTLLELANDELLKANTLQYTLSDSLENLLNTEEFKDHKDKLKIGDYLICEADEKLYRLRLIGVSYGYGSPDKINVTFSNYVAIENYFSDAQNILATAKSMSTSYGAVMHQVDKSANVTDEVTTWMEDSLSSAVTTITNNDNEEVTIDENGIIAREFDDVSNTYSDEQLRITHNIIAFTEDNWEHSTLGLGKQSFMYYNDDPTKGAIGWVRDAKGYGLNAKFVNSGYIYGGQIVGSKVYSTNYRVANPLQSITADGSMIDLDEGNFSLAGGGLIGYKKPDGTYYLSYGGAVTGHMDVDVGSTLGAWVVYADGLYSGSSVLKPDNIYVSGNVRASDFQLGNTLLSSILDKKQAKLNAGNNITLTPEQDGTVTISAAGGGGGAGVLYGTTPPSDSVGNEEDFYLKLGLVESGTISDQSYTCTTVDLDSFSLNNNKYDIEVSGVPQTAWDYIMFQIDGLEEDEDYTVSFDIQFGQGTTFAHGDYGNWSQVLHTSTPSGSYDVDPTRTDAVVFEHNLDLQHCSYTFTAEENNYIIFTFHNCQDWQQFTASISGLSINNGETSDHINAIYNKHNNKWLEYIDGNGGQGLQYFVETPNSLYGRSQTDITIDPAFVFEGQAGLHARFQGGMNTLLSMDSGVVIGWYESQWIKELRNDAVWNGIFLITDDINKARLYYKFEKEYWWDVDSEGVMTYQNAPNASLYPCTSNLSMYGFSSSVEIEGTTYYLLIIASNWLPIGDVKQRDDRKQLSSCLNYMNPYQSGTYTETDPEHGYYKTFADWIRTVLGSSLRIYYNGLSRSGKLAFFAGGEDENGTDAPIKIYGDGTADGLVTQHDFENADFTGATSSENGTHGLVPQPLIADRGKFLRGDGTWAQESVFNSTTNGLVPTPNGLTTSDYSLRADGTWVSDYTDFYLENGLIGSAGGSYITCPLDKNMTEGDYKFTMRDGSTTIERLFTWEGSTVTLDINGDYTMQITETSAQLTWWRGSWRNIYGDIIKRNSVIGTEVEANPSDPATDSLNTIGIDGTIYDIPVGTEVEANPSGTATADLNKIQVGNTIYQIPQGGGSEVEANPTGTATDTLNTISINGTIYEIEGGGSGGESTQIDVLFSKTPDNVHEPTITLSDSLFDYDMITIDYAYVNNNIFYHIGHSYMTDDLNVGDNIGFESGNGNTWYNISNNTTLTLAQSQTTWCVVSIIGTKYGSGGSGGGGFDATELYSGTSYSGNITLSEPYTNFDYILFTGYATSGTGFLQSNLYKVEDLLVDNNIGVADDGNFSWWKITSDTTLTNNGSVGTYYVKKIYGLKASSGGGNFYKKTTAEYQALPLSDKIDPDKLYFIDNSGEQIAELNNTNWVNSTESNMNISIINNKLTYAWSGGTDIGANSVYSVAIPASVDKIRFKITTGTSYYNTYDPTIERFKVFIGVRPTYTTGFIYPPNLSDWLALEDFNIDNGTWEDELDLSNISEDSYLYISGHGWNMTIDSLQLVTESGDTTNNCIYYQNIKYADNASSGNVDDVYVNGESVLDTDKIAQVKTHKEVSLAEYEDVNDDIIYFVDDDDDELGIYYSPIIYSTEEREVGTWTNGKPLYEKTIYVGSMTKNSSWNPIAHNINNIEKVIKLCGQTKQSSDGRMYNIPHYRPYDNKGISIGADTTYVYYMNTWLEYASDTYVTIQYTKTTDTPGSAKYNALGVPMIHYSTDEQVIGTWIDGKPIYRKIYDWTASPFLVSNSWQNTTIDSTNMDRIISAIGMHQDGTLYNDTCADPTKSSHTRVGIKAWADGYYAYLILEYTKTTD